MSDASDYFTGNCEAFRGFLDQLGQVAGSDATVLLAGESGSGKEVAARLLHAGSARSEGPFVVVHLGALSTSLIESELFGHERGAFTDAHRDRRGCFQRADGGTLVLDDVDLVPLDTQVKLLRVLQERVVEPLGAEQALPIDVRVVVTTSRDLLAEAGAGRFRTDLYYRLAVVPLEVPPLRARLADLPGLVAHLLDGLAARLGVPRRGITEAALERLERHPWPGNVRELENALERVLVLAPAARPGSAGEGAAETPPPPPPPIEAEELEFLAESTHGVGALLAREALANGLSVEDMELAMMERALEDQRGNVSAAARAAGMARSTFRDRLRAIDR